MRNSYCISNDPFALADGHPWPRCPPIVRRSTSSRRKGHTNSRRDPPRYSPTAEADHQAYPSSSFPQATYYAARYTHSSIPPAPVLGEGTKNPMSELEQITPPAPWQRTMTCLPSSTRGAARPGPQPRLRLGPLVVILSRRRSAAALRTPRSPRRGGQTRMAARPGASARRLG